LLKAGVMAVEKAAETRQEDMPHRSIMAAAFT
jgi:hypothetical protein